MPQRQYAWKLPGELGCGSWSRCDFVINVDIEFALPQAPDGAEITTFSRPRFVRRYPAIVTVSQPSTGKVPFPTRTFQCTSHSLAGMRPGASCAHATRGRWHRSDARARVIAQGSSQASSASTCGGETSAIHPGQHVVTAMCVEDIAIRTGIGHKT